MVLVLMVILSPSSLMLLPSSTSSSSIAEKCSPLLLQGQLLDLVDGEVEVLGLVRVHLDHLARYQRLSRAQLAHGVLR